MRKAVWLALVLILLHAAPALAWGFAAHRLMMARAIDALPSALQPFFQQHRDELLIRVTDPDVWRAVGWDDDPNHFLNLGVEAYGPYPFTLLPRELDAAIERFGTDALRRNGLLPWRQAEEFGNLRRAFAGFPRSADNIVLFAGVSAHYVQDGHQPFHATENFDGQQTGNRGIHGRFERDLIVRYESRLALARPVRVTPMTNARDAAFDALLTSHQAVGAILRADTEAAAGRATYDDAYFDRFFIKVRPILEERLSTAVSATVALIIGAWEQAGRPRVQAGP
jgi:hypothetical protein